MKRILSLLISILTFFSATAQKKDFTYKFYGFVRGELFYNTRANVASANDAFCLYPLDEKLDADGKDLNASPNGGFYSFATRLGVELTGPKVGSARTSGRIEGDFCGGAGSTATVRLLQAYLNLDWGKSSLLAGQTWHPLTNSLAPDVLNLSTGAPFQPFSRAPQIRYQYLNHSFKLTAATIWQLQSCSSGPNGKSGEYLKNSCIPELFLGADYIHDRVLAGAGVHLLSLKPRTSSTWNDQVYKVNERMTTLSYEAHAKYTGRNFCISGKTILSSCLDFANMLGGYGVSGVNPTNGEMEYTPFRYSSSWVNFTYGKKWKPSLLLGYAKNLGTADPLISNKMVFGSGTNVDQLVSVSANFSYNLPHWLFGVEYTPMTAFYGTIDTDDGRVGNTHSVTNHRVLGVAIYLF